MIKIVLIGAGSSQFGLGTISDIFKSKQLRDLAKILAIVVFPTPLIPVNKNALGILFNEIDFFIASTIIF